MNEIRFTKMEGAGNDYVYLNCFNETISCNLPELAKRIADRNFGVGGDGLILIEPSEIAPLRMRMFNADGSEAEMCGNGLRCVAKYAYEHGVHQETEFEIETGAGVKGVQLRLREGVVEGVRIDMGAPELSSVKIPTAIVKPQIVDESILIGSDNFNITCVSMGNPHCVIFVDELTDELVQGVGPQIENHSYFPERINVEFVKLISNNKLVQRTWERGSGETLACGTGASAVCVAGVLTGRTGRSVTIKLLGGELDLQWSEVTNSVLMTGPAKEVFSGVYYYEL